MQSGPIRERNDARLKSRVMSTQQQDDDCVARQRGPPLNWIVRATIGGLLVALATGAAPGATSASHSDANPLELACASRLDFKTIAEFRKFAADLKALDASTSQLGAKKDAAKLLGCLEERDSIEELDQLIENYDRLRPCKFSEVTKLESFAKRHLLANKRALVYKFFALFGVNIALKCKLNLLAHVRQADSEAEQLDFIYSMASPTGWNVLINEYTKKSMKFGTSGHADSHVINRVARLVPGLSQIEQLDYLDFHHSMDENTLPNWEGLERGLYKLRNEALRARVIDSLDRIIESCNNLDSFYVNSLMSLAKLRELGLVVEFLNELHERSVTLHKWLAATSFCQLMVRVRLLKDQNEASETELHFEIIHDDKLLENRNQLYSYVARFDEIDDRAREMVWHVSVNEAAWRQKGEAMWVPGNKGSSKAMNQLRQFIKGVEFGFQQERDDAENYAG